MHPRLVTLAERAYPHRRNVALLAWQGTGDRRRLVGVWVLTVRRAPRTLLPVKVLTMPAMSHTAMPVIDRNLLDATLQAMLTRIAGDPTLPKLAALDGMADDSATVEALTRVLAERRGGRSALARWARPKLASPLDGKAYFEQAMSSGSRKKLRQYRRRLTEKGKLESRFLCEPEAVREALDQFLQLEAAGWKGKRGSALVDSGGDLPFTRAMVDDLAQRGDAAVHALYLDGAPVSMQIVLYARPMAYTWKTVYDENWRDFSPGMLLFEEYTAALLAEESVDSVDSCAHDETSFMAVWRERQPSATLWIDCRPGASATLAAVTGTEKTFLHLRGHAKRLYHSAKAKRTRS
jgi:CelD/BcsL family acetyltransferase involved in cellulose biosynthesis